jgi:hypothetical protein
MFAYRISRTRFAGVVYVYPVYPGRVTTNDCSNVKVFGKICGDAGLSKFILATTRWNLCAEAVGESREKELVETFSTNLLRNPQGAEGKAKTMRLHNTTDSAREIIEAILEKMAQSKINGVILGLQDQLMIRNKRFQQTEAAKELKIKLVEPLKDTESRIIK